MGLRAGIANGKLVPRSLFSSLGTSAGAHMEARLYADPVNTSIQNGDKKKKVERAAKIVDTIYVVNPLNPKIKI